MSTRSIFRLGFAVAATLCASHAMAGGSAFFQTDPCTILRTASVGGAFASGETRNYLIRGETTDLSGQGGDAAGCGVPEEAQAILVNVIASGATSSGAIKAWAFGESEPGKFMNVATADTSYNGATVVGLGDSGLASDFSVKSFNTSTQLIAYVVGYFIQTEPTVLLDGVDVTIHGLRYTGSSSGGSQHSLTSNEGYTAGIVSGGSLQGNIIYYQSSDCTCSPSDCSGGQAYVSGWQPGTVIRGTDGSDPFGSNRVFYVAKNASYVTDFGGTNLGNGTGSRRVTSSCQANQSLTEGFPVQINNAGVTGIETGAAGSLDATARHWITFE